MSTLHSATVSYCTTRHDLLHSNPTMKHDIYLVFMFKEAHTCVPGGFESRERVLLSQVSISEGSSGRDTALEAWLYSSLGQAASDRSHFLSARKRKHPSLPLLSVVIQKELL